MLEILRPTEHKLERLSRLEKPCWINIVHPTERELGWLKHVVPISDKQIELLNNPDQIPSIEDQKSYTFVIAQTPFDDKTDTFGYRTVPLGIFITNDIVVTICFFHDDVTEHLKKERFEFRKTQLVFRLLLVSAQLYLQYLSDIRQKMYLVETHLSHTIGNKHIMELLELQKSLTYFDTALGSNAILLKRLSKEEKTNRFIMVKTTEDQKLADHMVDVSNQAIEVANVYSEILSNTLNAFTSIISNNLNNVIKVLTSVTIIIALPTMIASVYGMNVALPLQNHPGAFGVVMWFAFIISLVFLLVLWKKKFL